jgi:hypothetical protein
MNLEETLKDDITAKRKVKLWKNPLDGIFSEVPPVMIARTVTRLFRENSLEKIRANRRYRELVLRERYNWPENAILAFEVYIAAMTKTEAKRADQFGNEHRNKKASGQYQRKTMQQFLLKNAHRRNVQRFFTLRDYINYMLS